MSTLPDSAGVSCIFNKFQKSSIDNFSRRERSIPRNFTITSWREIALDKVVFHTFRQSVSCFPAWWKAVTADQGYQNTLRNLIDCFDNLNWSNCSHELGIQGKRASFSPSSSALLYSDMSLAVQESYQHCVPLRSLLCRERKSQLRSLLRKERNIPLHLGIRRVARPFSWQSAR